MFEDSSDEELCLPYRKTTACWECGKCYRDPDELMDHYRRHSVSATCHMCRITFRRQISLSIHLDNVHSPPICQKCSICFINLEELNRHAETDCKSLIFQNTRTVKLENHGSFIEYVVGEDGCSFKKERFEEDAPFNLKEESSCSEISLGKDIPVVIQTICSKANQTDMIHERPILPKNLISNYVPEMSGCQKIPSIHPFSSALSIAGSRGQLSDCLNHIAPSPLHHQKINLFNCVVCRNTFLNEQSHREHLRALYTCQFCEQVFLTLKLHSLHVCSSAERKSCLTMFCLNYGPKQCNICKAFFAHEKGLFQHINQAHKLVNKIKII